MTLPRTVADVLTDHVTFEVECIDRMYLNVWRTQRRHHADGSSYAWLVRASAFINFFYFYCVDADFGPFFLKFSTYFPYTAKLCINGNEWAKRQATNAGIGFVALDNGFAAVDDVHRLQQI